MRTYLLPVALLLDRSSLIVNSYRLVQSNIVEDMNLGDYSNANKDVTAYAATVASGKKFTNL